MPKKKERPRAASTTKKAEVAAVAKADPELLRQLTEAESADAERGLVEAVFRLDVPVGAISGATSTQATAESLLERATAACGSQPRDVHVFRNLNSFVVSASPPFLRALLEEPEVASAIANQQQESMKIPPTPRR